MAIKLKVASEHLKVYDEFVYLAPELSGWIQEKNAKVTVTHRMIVDPYTFLPAPIAFMAFEDETIALEYKLRWL